MQEANTADNVTPATDEDDESIDDVDLEGFFTTVKSNKNVVEAHKWAVKNKTLCIGLTKGNTAAFHKQNKLNRSFWQIISGTTTALRTRGFR